MSDATPLTSNHRAFPRRPARGRIKITCYKGSLDLGANLGVALVDISETGLRLTVKTPLEKNQEVLLFLESQRHPHPIKRGGNVVWCSGLDNGTYEVGVRFNKTLLYKELADFT